LKRRKNRAAENEGVAGDYQQSGDLRKEDTNRRESRRACEENEMSVGVISA